MTCAAREYGEYVFPIARLPGGQQFDRKGIAMSAKDLLGRTLLAAMMSGVLGLTMTLPSLATPADDGAKKTAALLDSSGYHYTKLTPKIWSIDFTGKSLPKFKVLVVGDELDVIFVIIADHDKYTFSPELAKKLLAFDSSMDRVKVGINDTGDLFVRVDVTSRTMDEADFKANVEQVAAASDEVYGGIQPLLSKSPFH
jgi:hypothetical protein